MRLQNSEQEVFVTVVFLFLVVQTKEQGGEGQTKNEHTNTEGRIGKAELPTIHNSGPNIRTNAVYVGIFKT